jgi:hypothetical protein
MTSAVSVTDTIPSAPQEGARPSASDKIATPCGDFNTLVREHNKALIDLAHMCFLLGVPVSGAIFAGMLWLQSRNMTHAAAAFVMAVVIAVACEAWLLAAMSAKKDGLFVSASIGAGIVVLVVGFICVAAF